MGLAEVDGRVLDEAQGFGIFLDGCIATGKVQTPEFDTRNITLDCNKTWILIRLGSPSGIGERNPCINSSGEIRRFVDYRESTHLIQTLQDGVQEFDKSRV